MDPRDRKLAEQLIAYSVKLQPGEKIYLEIKGLRRPVARATNWCAPPPSPAACRSGTTTTRS